MAEPEPRVTDAGVFIPFRQPEQDSPLPVGEIISRLGEVGLHGRPLELFENTSRETLLPYDTEQHPSLGVTSFTEFETFAYERRAPKGMPMKIWSNMARLSEHFAYVRAAENLGATALIEQLRPATEDFVETNTRPQTSEELIAASNRRREIEAALNDIDASIREVPPIQGRGHQLRQQLSSYQGDPFVFTDADCTQPLENHTGAYQRVNQAKILRTTYMSVDAMYALVARGGPANWSRIRGQRFDLVTIPFLNARITQAMQAPHDA